MKTKYLILTIIWMLPVILAGCGLDNRDEPKSPLRGKITYQGEALQLRGTDEKVRLQLYQDGYAYNGEISLHVGQDGSFSAMLFDGEYKMVTRNGNGPWVNTRDTIYVNVKGATEQNFEVTPFFTISNANLSLSGNTMNTSFTINQIVPSAEIERIILLLNRTGFVDDDINIQREDFTNNLTTGTVNYSIELNDRAKEADFLFGRICVWTKGADQGIYSPVVQFK